MKHTSQAFITIDMGNTLNILSILLLLVTYMSSIQSLTCESCQAASCPVLTDCKAGMVMDVCNCCSICAKKQGESCGGRFDLDGKCGIDLYCHRPYNTEGGDILGSSDIGTCEACEEVVYSGCSIIKGMCQCGNSCTNPFDYSDREMCLNSVQAQGGMENCLGKLCPQDISEPACPEDSYRPTRKLSLDGCCQITQPCRCQDNLCHSPPECPEGKRLAEISRGDGSPGSCCSQYTCVNATAFRCEFGNSTFSDGQIVNSDSCVECKCKNSVVACDYVQCEMPSCEWSAPSPGKCCPECKGCLSASTGEVYANGERWEENDSCTRCQCVNGQRHCMASACERRCRNPKKVPGQCCPVCDEPEDVYEALLTTPEPNLPPKRCPDNGTTCLTNCQKKIMVEINGCSICLCEDDVNMCAGSTSCMKTCPHGYRKNRELDCLYCRCNSCPLFSCNLVCADGYVKDKAGCNKCECKDNKQLSAVSACFTSEGRTFMSGDMWFDGCRECYCESGRELCSLISCPALSCSQPIVKAGDCCPSCLTDPEHALTLNVSLSCVDAAGSKHEEHDVWQLDTCTVCMCYKGQALCETQRCPPTLCTHPVKRDGHCCAACSDVKEQRFYTTVGKSCTTLSGTTFEHRSIWKVGDCQSCTCQNGLVTCFSQVCPSLQCKTTVQQKGQCCPKCTAESTYDMVCIYEGSWYKHLDTWSDNLLQCTCIHGNAECESLECASCADNDKSCCAQKDGTNDSASLSFELPMIIILSILLFVFAAVIVLLSIVLVHQRKKRKLKLTAIPKILEKRAASDALIKKRPKSTNLEFLHSTTENRYNNGINRGDTECFRPLVENNHHGNEYVQC